MTEEQMNVYKMRIAQAGIAEMTTIMLEMELQWMEDAVAAYEEKNLDEFVHCVDKAQAVQVELMNVMNRGNEVAENVYAVFAYINKQLIRSKIKRQPLEFDRLRAMLQKYHTSFQVIEKTDQGGPVMQQSEKVYAGLTYGAGGLVESSTGGMDYTV